MIPENAKASIFAVFMFVVVVVRKEYIFSLPTIHFIFCYFSSFIHYSK